MKLQIRFTLMAVLLAEVSLAGALFLSQALERRHLERKQLDNQTESLRRFARVGMDASLQFNEVFLLNYLKVLREAPELGYAAMLDDHGQVRMHSDLLDGVDAVGNSWEGPRHGGEDVEVHDVRWRGKEIQDWSLPLKRGPRRIGEVHLGFDAARLRDSIRRDLAESRRRLGWIALAMSALACLGAAWLARQLHAPLAALHEGARRLGEGSLDYRIEVERSDELGDLAEGFNRMAGELDRSNRFKEQLMASVTHDLRSPLLAIRGHAEILLKDEEASPEERQESAQLIYDNTLRLSAMADDITDLAKLQMGRLEIQRRQVPVQETLEAVRRLMDIVAQRLNIRLEVEAPPSLPTAYADPAHLDRLFTNLISNALKFTPSGGRVFVRIEPHAHHLKVLVSDTGMGIPAQKLRTIFSKFISADGKAEKGALGTGLGLSICRELVKAHGGKIWAESEWRRGTNIFFTLPLNSTPCSADC